MARNRHKLGVHRHLMAVASALILAGFAAPASGAAQPTAKLVYCGTESCLRISGQRESPTSIVRVNGHPVPAAGDRRWAVELPISTLRDWSAPHARTIEVSLDDPDIQREASASVDLPIGLLGGIADLSSLVVNVG